jgi:hypothetical protein
MGSKKSRNSSLYIDVLGTLTYSYDFPLVTPFAFPLMCPLLIPFGADFLDVSGFL